MLDKILNYIHNNKVLDWIFRNGFPIALGFILINSLRFDDVPNLIQISFIVVCLSVIETNFCLYTISNFRLSKDALKGANDGDGVISPIIQKSYLDTIGKIFLGICIVNGFIAWLVFSNVLR